jgi:hypothetical protein
MIMPEGLSSLPEVGSPHKFETNGTIPSKRYDSYGHRIISRPDVDDRFQMSIDDTYMHYLRLTVVQQANLCSM